MSCFTCRGQNNGSAKSPTENIPVTLVQWVIYIYIYLLNVTIDQGNVDSSPHVVLHAAH